MLTTVTHCRNREEISDSIEGKWERWQCKKLKHIMRTFPEPGIEMLNYKIKPSKNRKSMQSWSMTDARWKPAKGSGHLWATWDIFQLAVFEWVVRTSTQTYASITTHSLRIFCFSSFGDKRYPLKTGLLGPEIWKQRQRIPGLSRDNGHGKYKPASTGIRKRGRVITEKFYSVWWYRQIF